MKLNRRTKIIGIILGIVIAITASVSLALALYPYLFNSCAPQPFITVITALNFIIPIIGITLMLGFIRRRARTANDKL